MSMSSDLVVGDIIYCTHPKLTSPKPHYFVCVAKKGTETIFTVVCTSKVPENIERFREQKLPEKELIMIDPSDDNGLTVDTCISCRSVFDFSTTRIDQLHKEDKLDWTGKLEDDLLEQIVIGINHCELTDRNVKALLPKF